MGGILSIALRLKQEKLASLEVGTKEEDELEGG
jgi:hypothetical protein